jgi:queuine/archaeosine tRNA-ribosyltransferase
MHNVHYLLSLMEKVRNAIVEDRYPDFLHQYFGRLYAGEKSKIPQWAVTALRNVGVDLCQ